MHEYYCYGCSEPLAHNQNWSPCGYIQLCNHCWLELREAEAVRERIEAFNNRPKEVSS